MIASHRGPRVRLGGVSGVQEAPQAARSTNRRHRVREPVTEADRIDAMRAAQNARGGGVPTIVKAFIDASNAHSANDELAAKLADLITGTVLDFEGLNDMIDEEVVEKLADIDSHPLEPAPNLATGYVARAELKVRDSFLEYDLLRYLLRALDKDAEVQHILSFLRAFAALTVDSKSSVKLNTWLAFGHGSSYRGGNVLHAIQECLTYHGENQLAVAYSFMCLSAVSAVTGPKNTSYFEQLDLHKLMCDTLVFQSSYWPCARFGLQTLFALCGDDDTEETSWITGVSEANGIMEAIESIQRHKRRLDVVEPGVQFLHRLTAGRTNAADRRRNALVEADGVQVLLSVIQAASLLNAKSALAAKMRNTDSSLPQNPDNERTEASALILRGILEVVAIVCSGNTKFSDDRRMKLIGAISDEMCDLISQNPDSLELQAACFKILANYCESNKRIVASAFVEDVIAAGAITIATEVLFSTPKNSSARRWQEHPPTVVEALRFCANICRSECGEAAEDARVALMESKAAAGFVGILGNDFARHAGADESEKICVQVIRAIYGLISGLAGKNRKAVIAMGVCTNIAAALTAHMRAPLVVTQACQTLRILALQAWRPAASNKSVASKRAPTNHEIVLGFDVGSKSSETGRKAIIEARAHLAVCAALASAGIDGHGANKAAAAQKYLEADDETLEGGEALGSEAPKKNVAVEKENLGPQEGNEKIASAQLIQMVQAAASFLAVLALETGFDADGARDALMTANAQKIIAHSMDPMGPLRQAPVAMIGCMEAVRQFAGSGEFATSLMRKDLMERNIDMRVCSCMRAYPKDIAVQRAGCAALRNLSFGGREEGEVRRNGLVRNNAHVATCTALRLFLSAESDPTRQVLSMALQEAALGVIRNLTFGAGASSELRRQALFRERAPELVISALVVAKKAVDDGARGSQMQGKIEGDASSVLMVGVVALGNLMSGTGYLAENRRHQCIVKDSYHRPIIAIMHEYSHNAQMQHACLVALSSLCLGTGDGALSARSAIVEYELPPLGENLSIANRTGNAGGNLVSLTTKCLRRFAKDVQVTQAGIAVLTNLCIGSSISSEEMRVTLMEEGAHELILAAMGYFERKSGEKGAVILQVGLAFLQNFTAGADDHRPRQLLTSLKHLNFLPVLVEILTSAQYEENQIIQGHGVGLLGNLCIGNDGDDSDGIESSLPSAEARRQEILALDGPAIIATCLRSYRGVPAIEKACFKAIASFCEGRSKVSEDRRDHCYKLRMHVLVMESLKNISHADKSDANTELLEGGRLALGTIMYSSLRGGGYREKAIRDVLSDYELSMNIGCCVCFGQKSRREYHPFSADSNWMADRANSIVENNDEFAEVDKAGKAELKKKERAHHTPEGSGFFGRSRRKSATSRRSSLDQNALVEDGESNENKPRRRTSRLGNRLSSLRESSSSSLHSRPKEADESRESFISKKGSGSRSSLGVRRDSSINQGGRGIRNSGVSARSLLRMPSFSYAKEKGEGEQSERQDLEQEESANALDEIRMMMVTDEAEPDAAQSEVQSSEATKEPIKGAKRSSRRSRSKASDGNKNERKQSKSEREKEMKKKKKKRRSRSSRSDRSHRKSSSAELGDSAVDTPHDEDTLEAIFRNQRSSRAWA